MSDLAETAVVTSTGDRVRVLRRQGIAHDEAIMRALEAADCFVIGTPSGFRYRRPRKRKFTRPQADTVFLIDEAGRATTSLPGSYFQAHYRIVGGAL